MPPEAASLTEDRSGGPRLRLVPSAPLRVADVAMFYGERSGGIRTYLESKRRWARSTGRIDHHMILPGAEPRHGDGRHELPSLRLAATNGYRLPLGARALAETLRELEPDVVLLHDPFWRPLGVARTAHEVGARVVLVHHGSVALDAAGLPGPNRPWHPVLRAWMHHAYGEADAVMSAVDCRADTGRPADIPLRFGLHPAFRPRPDLRREDHVLYVGRLGREKGVVELLRAAARSREPWRLRLVGSGPLHKRLRRLAWRLGIAGRVQFHSYISDPARLARAYASARVVVMPGAHETFGLVGFEAAASGASVVTCSTAPSAALIGELVQTYEPGDIDGLLAAIETARAVEPDPVGSAALARRSTWAAALEEETRDLEALAGRGSRTVAGL